MSMVLLERDGVGGGERISSSLAANVDCIVVVNEEDGDEYVDESRFCDIYIY